MSMTLSRRSVILGGALLATGAAAQIMVPRNSLDLLGEGKLERIIPPTIGPWRFLSKSGLVTPPSDQLSDQLYSQLLTRVYVSENMLPMMLLIAQSPGQDGVLQVHRPEVCYPAGGYALSESRVHDIQFGQGRTIPTRVFSASGADRTEQLLYWTRVGSELPTSWSEQRLAVARANLRGDIPDAVLVRVSTLSTDPAALVELDGFAKALLGSVTPGALDVLAGRA